jgi:hypothetical protein
VFAAACAGQDWRIERVAMMDPANAIPGRKFTCQLSLDDAGKVETQWFLQSGRKTEPPHYLDVADRRQYRAGRDASLRATGKLPARLASQDGDLDSMPGGGPRQRTMGGQLR